LRELLGDQTFREEEMGDADSEISSGLSEVESEKEEEQWEGKGKGRPNFKRAAPGAGQEQSTQEFFRRGNHGARDDDDVFATPSNPGLKGALARSLSAVASSPQQVGTAQTLNSAETLGEGAGMEGNKGVGGMSAAVGDWAEEMSQSGDEMEGVAGPDRPETPTPPMPARWATPTPAPVTPTKGKKRMAVGTPRPMKTLRPGTRLASRPGLVGFAAQSALECILSAIARVEKRVEDAAAGNDARLVEGIQAVVAEAEAREARLMTRLLVDAEERRRG
jgi:hypothetical protein